MRTWTISFALLLAASIGGCRHSDSYEFCTPGASVLIGCSSEVGNVCTGDPTLTVCTDDVTPATCTRDSPSFLAFDDDDGDGFCPLLTFTCPASGRVAVNAEPYRAGERFTCPYDTREGL